MRLESFLFGGKLSYQRMADVLAYTAESNCSVPLSIRRVDVTKEDWVKSPKVKEHTVDNALKTKLHCDLIQKAKDGELIGLLDADLMILNDVAEIENYMEGMDFAYTVRSDKWPFNSGVVFVRVSDKTREWYRKWLENARMFLEKPSYFKQQGPRYGGINQCSLGLMLENEHDLNILQLPCGTWNCVPQTYAEYNPETTKIVHILGKLRARCVCGERGGTQYSQILWQKWNSFEHQLKTKANKNG